MEKMKFETISLVDKNIDKIEQIFPGVVTEVKDADGRIRKAVDFEALKAELSKDIVEGRECYEFTWAGKNEAKYEAAKPIRKTLRPCKEESKNWDTTQNLYIEGDNLDVLKLLQESYLNKVKMIYIDPPYNTGNDSFIYPDDYSENKDKYDEEVGAIDESGYRMFKNTETNGRFHSSWCSMMYPRLKLARRLLSDDGVIFISIDDHEVDNMRKMCDEVFGENNFVGQLILKTATDNNPSQINIEHEYMLCYSKNKLIQGNWERTSQSAQKINNYYKSLLKETNDIPTMQIKLREWIKINRGELIQVHHYNNIDAKGVYSSSTNSSNPHPGGYMYDIIHPVTHLPCPKPKNGWRWPEKTFLEYNKKGEVEWGKDHSTQPHIKKRIETAVEYIRSIIYEDNRATTKMLSDLFDGKKIFDNSKPTTIISKIIDFVTNKDSIILDFFSGSATTAHAAMRLNAEDGGKRKFVMVQLPEVCDEKSEAKRAGFDNICEIGKERIRRAGEKIKQEYGEKAENLDIGFRVFKLDSTNMKDVYYTPAELTQDLLAKTESNIKDDRTDMDLLYGCLLDWGLELSMPHETKQIDGVAVHYVNQTDLIACFNTDVPEAVIRKIAADKPLRVVFRDSCFKNVSDKTNVDELFKAISPETQIKVI